MVLLPILVVLKGMKGPLKVEEKMVSSVKILAKVEERLVSSVEIKVNEERLVGPFPVKILVKVHPVQVTSQLVKMNKTQILVMVDSKEYSHNNDLLYCNT